MAHRKVPRRQQLSLRDRLSSVVRLADEIMHGAARAEGGAGGGLTERSQSLLLINHCSVFDLSFAKGGKKGRRRVATAAAAAAPIVQ